MIERIALSKSSEKIHQTMTYCLFQGNPKYYLMVIRQINCTNYKVLILQGELNV
ncbi:MAG: hypothetical protein V7L00_19780 [Nostoc sp.]|uniref:hypothetical protein n=1 Tax=Nostoc sp. TaxID=1180 RepID=UPI002FF76D1B